MIEDFTAQIGTATNEELVSIRHELRRRLNIARREHWHRAAGMLRPLTESSEKLLVQMAVWTEKHDNAPSNAELASLCGWRSANSVNEATRRLVAHGYVEDPAGRVRHMRVLALPRRLGSRVAELAAA